jgi:hypothetical protein
LVVLLLSKLTVVATPQAGCAPKDAGETWRVKVFGVMAAELPVVPLQATAWYCVPEVLTRSAPVVVVTGVPVAQEPPEPQLGAVPVAE